MKQYAIVIEKAQSNYAAYVPELPGCVAIGTTVEEVEKSIREAIAFHLEGMKADVWDEQIERDAAAGKCDALAEEAL